MPLAIVDGVSQDLQIPDAAADMACMAKKVDSDIPHEFCAIWRL